MDWIKKHTDTAMVLGSIFAVFVWMSAQFSSIDNRFSAIERDVAIIKTVMVMKQIMPCELAENGEK